MSTPAGDPHADRIRLQQARARLALLEAEERTHAGDLLADGGATTRAVRIRETRERVAALEAVVTEQQSLAWSAVRTPYAE